MNEYGVEARCDVCHDAWVSVTLEFWLDRERVVVCADCEAAFETEVKSAT